VRQQHLTQTSGSWPIGKFNLNESIYLARRVDRYTHTIITLLMAIRQTKSPKMCRAGDASVSNDTTTQAGASVWANIGGRSNDSINASHHDGSTVHDDARRDTLRECGD
jgi:hypothetical protein